MTTITKSVTSDELLAMPADGYRHELVKGELIQMSPGDEHGTVPMQMAIESTAGCQPAEVRD